MTRIGTAVTFGDPVLAELLGAALDFAWIDLEHGALDVRDVQVLTLALQAAGCEAHVRLPDPVGGARLDALLDTGVDGVVVPHVEAASEVERLTARLHYPPRGDRGLGPRRGARWGRRPSPWLAAPPRCTVQIESPIGVARAREIAAIAGVDALVLGSADLALALGVPGEPSGDAVRAAADHVRDAATAAGVHFGVAGAARPAELAALGHPADLIVCGSDARLYATIADDTVRAVGEALEAQHAGA